MITPLNKLAEILEKYRKHYKGDPFWQEVATYYIQQGIEFRQMAKTRFKDGKFYCSGLTEKERWGCIWCCNLINEILGDEKKP